MGELPAPSIVTGSQASERVLSHPAASLVPSPSSLLEGRVPEGVLEWSWLRPHSVLPRVPLSPVSPALTRVCDVVWLAGCAGAFHRRRGSSVCGHTHTWLFPSVTRAGWMPAAWLPSCSRAVQARRPRRGTWETTPIRNPTRSQTRSLVPGYLSKANIAIK